MRSGELLLKARHLRFELSRLGLSGLNSAGLAPRFFGVRPSREPLRRAFRHADRCELYSLSRRSSRPTSPGRVQRSASSSSRSRYSALNCRRVGLGHDLRGRGSPRLRGLGPRGLVATLLAPQRRRPRLRPRHRFSPCSHRHSPPPPSNNSKVSRCLNDVGREGMSSRGLSTLSLQPKGVVHTIAYNWSGCCVRPTGTRSRRWPSATG